MTELQELMHRFEFHPATNPAVAHAHDCIRRDLRNIAAMLHAQLPDGREKSVALTKLQEVMHWANSAIALNHHAYTDDTPEH